MFAAELAAMAGVWLLTGSEALQMVVLLFGFCMLALMRRREDEREQLDVSLRGMTPPWRIFAASLILAVPFGVAFYLAAEAIDLGLVWGIALVWAWGEIYLALERHHVARHGTSTWRPDRPVREGAIAFVITSVAIAAIALSDGAGWLDALVSGILCGFIVLGLGLVFNWLERRPGTRS